MGSGYWVFGTGHWGIGVFGEYRPSFCVYLSVRRPFAVTLCMPLLFSGCVKVGLPWQGDVSPVTNGRIDGLDAGGRNQVTGQLKKIDRKSGDEAGEDHPPAPFLCWNQPARRTAYLLVSPQGVTGVRWARIVTCRVAAGYAVPLVGLPVGKGRGQGDDLYAHWAQPRPVGVSTLELLLPVGASSFTSGSAVAPSVHACRSSSASM